MASINMSLDEIIQKNKKTKPGFRSGGGAGGRKQQRGGARRSTGGGGGGFRAPKAGAARKGFGKELTPPGKWKHDKFKELESGRGTAASHTAASNGGGALAGNPNRKVRVNISNLAPSVVTADLEELFEPYQFETVTVHFNEAGEPIGTGDVTLKRKDATRMLNDFKGINLDGQLLKMVIVDGTMVQGGITSRLQFTAKPQISRSIPRVNQGGIRKKFGGGGGSGAVAGRRRSGAGNPAKFLDRLADESPKKGGGGGGGKGGRFGREKKATKTAAQLDAELEAYMSSK